MNARKIETMLTQDRKLVLEGLPFRAGDTAEIIILAREGSEAEAISDRLAASHSALREV